MRFFLFAKGIATALTLLAVQFYSLEAAEQRPAREGVHVIEIESFQFRPSMLTIEAGEKVVWINRDLAPHTATAKQWDTGRLERQSSSKPLVLPSGRHHYICEFHPRMKAVIVVKKQPSEE